MVHKPSWSRGSLLLHWDVSVKPSGVASHQLYLQLPLQECNEMARSLTEIVQCYWQIILGSLPVTLGHNSF